MVPRENEKYATKEDLAAVRDDLKAELKAMEERLREYVHDVETKLLRAFYTFAEGHQKHHAQLDHSDAALSERLISLEARVLQVEKRLNMPPS